MRWNRIKNKRTLPWKGEKDPYKIWLSEIILQQTRAEQGWNYYERFIQTYPNVISLATAKDEVVFKLWEGLGYYSRCRNLLFSARAIAANHKGVFPSSYEEILHLKGIGAYTAAAISSFAYNLPYAVLDGNVFRVLSRVFGIYTPIDSNKGKKEFSTLAQQLLNEKHPGEYNQAIMDFGATVCKPVPDCNNCPFRKKCYALTNDCIDQLPVKEKKLIKKSRWFTYFILKHEDFILVNQRIEKDIWKDLYEFLLYEHPAPIIWNKGKVEQWLSKYCNVNSIEELLISKEYKQQLTHQQIRANFITVKLLNRPISTSAYNWMPISSISNLAFPKLINNFLQEATSGVQLRFL